VSVERIFYVTQGSLSIWVPEGGRLTEVAVFTDDDDGLRQFEAYQQNVAEKPSTMLIDVVEEEFALETIPKLGIRDRNSLIARRCQNKFRRTPYRQSIFQGKAGRDSGEFNVLHSAVSNHELVDPWLQIILQHRTPLSGVYSVPLIAPSIFKQLFGSHRAVMFVAPHQGRRLRQVFMDNGHLRSARMSQAPAIDDDAYAQFIISETLRSRSYLERTRLLNNMQVLEVCVVANRELADRITELSSGNESLDYSFIDPAAAGKKLLGRELAAPDHFEETYLAHVAARRPKQDYARAGENRYWYMRRARQVILGGAAAVAAACSIMAGVLLSDTWFLHGQVKAIQAQVAQLSETFRRENEKFDPIKADSHEMKMAVDTGDFILENRLPVPWVMNQVGVVLGDFPDIQVRELRWQVDVPQSDAPPPRRGDRPMPIPIHPVTSISAVMTAEIAPFDGNMRKAFERIDQLTRDLERKTDFTNSFTVEYPFNDNPAASVSGEISDAVTTELASFRLSLTYQVPGATDNSGEGSDDTV